MGESRERKLAVIVHADVIGSTALVQRDEGVAHRRITDAFGRFAGAIARYHGTVREIRGDALVAEFARASDAVSAALAFQRDNASYNASLTDGLAPRVRVGIALGEVVFADATVTGAGVVLAQRVEQHAGPDGVCVTGAVYEAIPARLPFDYADLGAQQLKGFDAPVHAWAVTLRPGASVPAPDGLSAPSLAAAARRRRDRIIAAAAALGLALAGFAVWLQSRAPTAVEAEPRGEAASTSAKPSVAVLPFKNISQDREQEYFADGMTEDLITDLSKISNLDVISRTSTSGYKGKTVDIREVGQALNVRYLIEGSVRKSGGQVRINAQLIDASSGAHLWAERYDGDLSDIFALQDRVLEKIVASLALQLSGEERRRLTARGTDSVAAHDLYLRGLYQESTFTRDGYREAMRLYEQALAIDAGYALPYARMANLLELGARYGWSSDVQADLARAVELAEKAIALDPQNPRIHWSLGRAVARRDTPGALQRGIEAMQRAIDLDPEFADAYAYLTVLYIADGRAEDGLRSAETAMRLNPRHPFWYLFMRGMARYVLEDYAPAIADFEAATQRSPTAQFVRWWLAASYAQVGRTEDAEWQVEELRMMGFEGSIATILDTQPIQDPGYLKIMREGLLKAGLPE